MISGWITFDATVRGPAETTAGPVKRDGGLHVAGNGFDVSASGRDADLAARHGLIVACTGRPRFDDQKLDAMAGTQGFAHAWAELLHEKGAHGLHSVGGPFAIALIDRTRGTALAACDRFAIEPLCYSYAGGRFAFATRADAVPAGENAAVDLQAIYEYLYYHMIPTPRTVFRGISRIPPAYFVEANAHEVRSAPHW